MPLLPLRRGRRGVTGKRSDVLWMHGVRCFDVHAWGMALDGSVDWVRLALKEADFSGDGGVVLICILKS